MCTDNFIITKRNGTTEPLSIEKIKSAIIKAFQSQSKDIDAETLNRIMQRLRYCNGMSVEDVQNQVEVALMAEHHYQVAKAFMLYRKRHEDDRETADKLRFLINYCNSTNPATGSKYDSNANAVSYTHLTLPTILRV